MGRYIYCKKELDNTKVSARCKHEPREEEHYMVHIAFATPGPRGTDMGKNPAHLRSVHHGQTPTSEFIKNPPRPGGPVLSTCWMPIYPGTCFYDEGINDYLILLPDPHSSYQ